MKAEKGSLVSVDYKLYIDDPSGELVEETVTDEPYEFIIGSGDQFEAFDKHIIGLKKGDHFSFAISKEDGFGEIDDEAVTEIPKKAFEYEGKIDESIFEMYNVLPMKDNEGNEFSGVVIAIGEDTITLDFNHPLAGENIWFDGTILDVKKA
jgi:FKBP-type peptidyl-prolyl cis-trans isomerase SlyD